MKRLILLLLFIVQSMNGYAQYEGVGAEIESANPNEWSNADFKYCYFIGSEK